MPLLIRIAQKASLQELERFSPYQYLAHTTCSPDSTMI